MQRSRKILDQIMRQIQVHQFGHIVKCVQIDIDDFAPAHIQISQRYRGHTSKTIDIISAQIDAGQIIILSKRVRLDLSYHIERKIDIL